MKKFTAPIWIDLMGIVESLDREMASEFTKKLAWKYLSVEELFEIINDQCPVEEILLLIPKEKIIDYLDRS